MRIKTRREFMLGAASVLALPHVRFGSAGERKQRFAYVACGAGEQGAICVLHSREDGPWSQVQRVPSLAPAFVLHAPVRQMLYVANDVRVHEGLARGTVESFRVHPLDGTLSLVSRTPLSLSATHPRHLALSPDGKWLAVAAYGGGVYNLLPVAHDGIPGPPRGIFKETGCGVHTALQASAHPHTLLFDSSGEHLLASDFGADRISVFSVRDGRLVRESERVLAAGSGPGSCVLHPEGFLYAAHDLGQRIACYRYDAAGGGISEPLDELAFPSSPISLALHPSGHVVYASHSRSGTLQVFEVNARNGKLQHVQSLSLGHARSVLIAAAGDGREVSLVDKERGWLLHAIADPTTGRLCTPVRSFALQAI